MAQKITEGHEFEPGLHHPMTGKPKLSTQHGYRFESRKAKAAKEERWTPPCIMLCPRHNGTPLRYGKPLPFTFTYETFENKYVKVQD